MGTLTRCFGTLCLFSALLLGSCKAESCSVSSPDTCATTDQVELLQKQVRVAAITSQEESVAGASDDESLASLGADVDSEEGFDEDEESEEESIAGASDDESLASFGAAVNPEEVLDEDEEMAVAEDFDDQLEEAPPNQMNVLQRESSSNFDLRVEHEDDITTEGKKRCKKGCAKKAKKKTWKKLCQKSNCAGCSQCSLEENKATKTETDKGSCKKWCKKRAKKRTWKKQCKQTPWNMKKGCGGCPECSLKENQYTEAEKAAKVEKEKRRSGRGGRRFKSWMKKPKSDWPPYPTSYSIVGRSLWRKSSVEVSKTHYSVGEAVSVTFADAGLQKSRYPPAVTIFSASRLKAGVYVNPRYAAISKNTCATDSGKCNPRPRQGTVKFITEGDQAKKLGVGCYAVGLYGAKSFGAYPGLVAVSGVFSVGPPDMVTCTEPSWKKVSGGTEFANLGSGDGFSATAHRYAMDATPWSPFGGWKQDEDQGTLTVTRMNRAYWLGPKTFHGNYGIPKYYFAVKRSDGCEGVFWQDKVDDDGRMPFGDIKVTWLSLDHASETTSILYSNPKGAPLTSLHAVAFNHEKNKAIVMLGLDNQGKTVPGGKYEIKFVKFDLLTMGIIKEGNPQICGDTFGIVKPWYEVSMAWSSRSARFSVVVQGNFVGGHQGARAAVFDDASFQAKARKIVVSSHNAGNENGVLSDGTFFFTALSDVFPRGIVLARYDYKQKLQMRKKVPYTYMGGNYLNDNKVYSTLARPGIEETDDGENLLMFFTGENPTLDKVFNEPRQVGYVKIQKDLREILSGDNVEWGYWEGAKRNLTQQGVKWLTDFSEYNAFNLKTARLGPGRILLYWEVWTSALYIKSQLMLVDDSAAVVKGPWSLAEKMGSSWSDSMFVTENDRVVMFVGDCEFNCGANSWCARSHCYMVRYELCAGADC